jgi:hypothetical protein
VDYCPIVRVGVKILLWTEKVILQKSIDMKSKSRLVAAVKIWIIIYPSITLFLFLFGERMAHLRLYQRTFLLTVALVPWIVFVGLPLLEVALRSFHSEGNKTQNL